MQMRPNANANGTDGCGRRRFREVVSEPFECVHAFFPFCGCRVRIPPPTPPSSLLFPSLHPSSLPLPHPPTPQISPSTPTPTLSRSSSPPFSRQWVIFLCHLGPLSSVATEEDGSSSSVRPLAHPHRALWPPVHPVASHLWAPPRHDADPDRSAVAHNVVQHLASPLLGDEDSNQILAHPAANETGPHQAMRRPQEF